MLKIDSAANKWVRHGWSEKGADIVAIWQYDV
jgi:hypothetical protein